MVRSSISIESLLTPTATAILSKGTVIKNKERSLWLFAQDLFGWKNWLQAKGVPFVGDTNQMFQDAGRKLNLSKDEANQILETANTDNAIPSCVYKGNDDEAVGFNGDIPAWAHVFNLEPSLAEDYCPPEMKGV